MCIVQAKPLRSLRVVKKYKVGMCEDICTLTECVGGWLNHYATKHIDVVVFHEIAAHRRRCAENAQAARSCAALMRVSVAGAARSVALSAAHTHLLHAACAAHGSLGH